MNWKTIEKTTRDAASKNLVLPNLQMAWRKYKLNRCLMSWQDRIYLPLEEMVELYQPPPCHHWPVCSSPLPHPRTSAVSQHSFWHHPQCSVPTHPLMSALSGNHLNIGQEHIISQKYPESLPHDSWNPTNCEVIEESHIVEWQYVFISEK